MKFKLDVSDVTVVDRPSYLARSMIINPAGKHVKHTLPAAQGQYDLPLGGPTTKKEIYDWRVTAAKECPLRIKVRWAQ